MTNLPNKITLTKWIKIYYSINYVQLFKTWNMKAMNDLIKTFVGTEFIIKLWEVITKLKQSFLLIHRLIWSSSMIESTTNSFWWITSWLKWRLIHNPDKFREVEGSIKNINFNLYSPTSLLPIQRNLGGHIEVKFFWNLYRSKVQSIGLLALKR